MTIHKDSKQGHQQSPDMMAALSMSHQNFPVRHSAAGSLFRRWIRYSLLLPDFISMVTWSVTVYCYVLTFLWFNSLMIFGRGGHRKLLRRSAKKTEVGDVFNPSVKFCFVCSNWFPHSCPILDLDSAVSSGGLDQILTPPAGQAPNQPRTRSFFQSVMVSKVVKPDGVRETVYLDFSINHLFIYSHSRSLGFWEMILI